MAETKQSKTWDVVASLIAAGIWAGLCVLADKLPKNAWSAQMIPLLFGVALPTFICVLVLLRTNRARADIEASIMRHDSMLRELNLLVAKTVTDSVSVTHDIDKKIGETISSSEDAIRNLSKSHMDLSGRVLNIETSIKPVTCAICSRTVLVSHAQAGLRVQWSDHGGRSHHESRLHYVCNDCKNLELIAGSRTCPAMR